jgi:hypothetical protein
VIWRKETISIIALFPVQKIEQIREIMGAMKEPWQNPVDRPAKQSTLDTPGDFGKFTDLMRKVVSSPPKQVMKPSA